MVCAAQTVTLLKNGQEKFSALFAAVDSAHETIHMEYFNFRNDSIAHLLFNHLRAKSAEGVRVRLLYDAFGNASNNQPLKKEHLASLRADSIEVYEFDPIRFPWVNHVFSRDHRKIVIIDDSIAFTGGMNVADYYINGTEVVGEWHDMHCRLTDPEAVRQLQTIFVRIWNRTADDTLAYPHGELLPSTVTIVNREPNITPEAIRNFYKQALDSAQTEVRIINPYFTLTPAINRALKRTLKRGVNLQLLLSCKSDIPLTPDCGYYYAHKLMKRGADVWLFEPGFHHTKIITVDSAYCSVGSANLNARSLRWDYEAIAVINDSIVTEEMNQHFDAQKQRAFYLTEERWRSWRTPWQRLRGWFAHLLAPFL